MMKNYKLLFFVKYCKYVTILVKIQKKLVRLMGTYFFTILTKSVPFSSFLKRWQKMRKEQKRRKRHTYVKIGKKLSPTIQHTEIGAKYSSFMDRNKSEPLSFWISELIRWFLLCCSKLGWAKSFEDSKYQIHFDFSGHFGYLQFFCCAGSSLIFRAANLSYISNEIITDVPNLITNVCMGSY